MKKNILLLSTIFALILQIGPMGFAASYSKGSPLNLAIKKYKAGNYTGCLQSMQEIVKRDPSNAIAHYYMAMSYAQAGRTQEAINQYNKVLSLNPQSKLVEYATTGRRCLETPDQCKPKDVQSDLDKVIAQPFGDGLSPEVRAEVEKRKLQGLMNEINKDSDVNNYKFQQFKQYGNSRTEVPTENKVAQEDKQPTNDEIVSALKVLQKAGLNPYANAANPYAAQPQMTPQNAEMMQAMAMLGGGQASGGNNNNNNMMNMLPYMMAQKGNGGTNYTPQIMQAMLMNSMLPDFNFDTDKNR